MPRQTAAILFLLEQFWMAMLSGINHGIISLNQEVYMGIKVLLNAASTATSEPVELQAGDSIVSSGIAGAETVALQVLVKTGVWAPVLDSSGVAITLTTTRTTVTISGFGKYRVVVSGASSVNVSACSPIIYTQQ